MMDNNEKINSYNDEIDFKELFNVILGGKWIIFIITSIFSIAAILYSLSLPNIYKSQALLSPSEGTTVLNQSMSSYSGIASLAGINIPSQSSDSNAVKAIEKLKTFSFFEKNILPNIYLPDLIAIDSWNASTNEISYKKDLYDAVSEKWIRDFKFPQKQTPTPQEAFNIFVENNILVSVDVDTGFVRLAIKHQSPFIAKAWTELIVNELNEFYRKKDRTEAEMALKFLNNKIAQTNFAEIKLVIAQLIQQKTQQLTLIEANKYYVFDYLDPPAVMERKAEPKRSIICIIGLIIGGLLSILIVLIRHYAFLSK